MDGLARLDDDSATKTEDRVEHCSGAVRQGTSVDDGGRRTDRAAAEKACPVGLELDDPVAVVLDVARCAAQTRSSSVERGRRGEQGIGFGIELGLDEQVLEGRVSDVGGLRGEHQLQVRGQLELAARTEVRERDRRISASSSADTVIVRPVVIDRRVARFGLVLAVRHLVGVRLSSGGLVSGRPDGVRVGVAHVQEAAPRIA